MRKMYTLLHILVFGLLLSSCTEEEVTPPDSTPPPVATPFSILALGDSYTIGQSVPVDERWPIQLQAELGEESIEVDSVQIIAQTGWTTLQLQAAIDNVDPQGPYDLVTLLIGVNDQYQGIEAADYAPRLAALLDMAIELAGGAENVIVVSIPDYGVTPFGQSNAASIAADIDAFNGIALQQSAALEIPFIDVTSISRELGASEGALAPDNLHPSGYQYSLWTEEILSGAIEVLSD